MQGKERNQNSEIDKQFVDRAWSNMSELLDREMPVEAVPPKSDNKKYLTLLLLLMVGFLLGIGSMAFLGEQEEVPVIQPPVVTPIPSNIPVANTVKPTDLNLAIESENVVVPETNREAEAVAKTVLSNKNVSTKSVGIAVENISNQIVTITNYRDQKSPKESVTFHANEQAEKTSVVYSEFYKRQRTIGKVVDKNLLNIEIGEVVNSEIAATENVLPEKLEEYLATADILDLPSASMSELDARDRTIDSELILPKTPRWKLAAIGGMHMINGYAGWEAGMLAEYQLNPRFAIQSGLTLKSLKKDAYLDIYDLSNYDLSWGGNSITDPNLSIGDLENNTVAVEGLASGNRVYLERLNYVNTPLLLSYQPTSFMKVLLGMNLAYRFNFVDEVIDDVANKSSDDRANVQESTGQFSVDGSGINHLKNGIRKMDVSGVFGIGIYPTKNIGIDLRYHLGFQDYTNDAYFTIGETHTNQSLQLSLIHYFGK